MTHPRMQAGVQPATDPARRVTVDQHQAFRRTLAPAPRFDDDNLVLDFIDRPAARRGDREINRLLGILDSLPPAREEMERSNHR